MIYIFGNWKMNLGLKSAVELANSMCQGVDSIPEDVEIALFPPNILIYPVKKGICVGNRNPKIVLGAQNVHWQKRGAYTGETSVSMLKGLCKYVMVGHSERRRHFGENNAKINKKINTIIKNGLVPVICVGEQLEGSGTDQWEAVLSTQISSALYMCSPDDKFIFAYEPSESIGTGRFLDPEIANKRSEYIKERVAFFFDGKSTTSTPVLYGGSVDEHNAKEFLTQSCINGLLIGAASLEPDRFCAIVKIASAINDIGTQK